MKERILEIAGGNLQYEVKDGRARVTGFGGTAAEVTIPGELEGYPVAKIGKKAFLSRKQLRKISLPDSLEEIGDWAFAYCSNLSEACLPEKKLQIGKNVFQECGELKRIEIRPLMKAGRESEISETDAGISGLLAAAVTAMDSYYLLDAEAAGSTEWFGKWDARLRTVLRTSDTEGYSRQILCGEEDYGSTDLNSYMRERRKEKVRLALLRLLYPANLSIELRNELEQYLLAHTAGCETDETWQVICREHGDDKAYYSMFQKLGCANGTNLNKIIADIGDGYPEMKAFFLSGSNTTGKAEAFFDDLEL